MKDVSIDRRPVVRERSLHLADHGPFDPEVRIAPVLGILRIASPRVGDADATCKANASIDNQQLAVSPVIEPINGVPLRRVVTADFHPGQAQLFERGLVDALASDPIQYHVYFDAMARSLCERIGEFAPDVAGPVNVGLERDGLDSRADGEQHRRENFVTIKQCFHAVSIDQRRA